MMSQKKHAKSLIQKHAKVNWLKYGDENTCFFIIALSREEVAIVLISLLMMARLLVILVIT